MKVLCAIDGSEFSRWSVEAVGALAGKPPKSLVLLHALNSSDIDSSKEISRALKEQSYRALEKAGNNLLQRMEKVARQALSQPVRAPMTKIQAVLTRGVVGETVVRQARRRRVDLIVIGSRGFSDFHGFLLGSVSRYVVAHAPCPVLVVKKRLPASLEVVLGVDSSKFSKKALQFLMNTFAGEQGRLTVLSVVAPLLTDLGVGILSPSQTKSLTKPRHEQLNRVIKEYRDILLAEGFAATTCLLAGHPSHMIVQYLETHRADLVVVGSRELTGNERLQLGSVSESVLKYAPCSVLVVRGRG